MIDQEAVEHELLSLATEDWTHLWEAASVCARLFPGATEHEIRESVRLAADTMIATGWLELTNVSFSAPDKPLSKPEISTLLSDPRIWDHRSERVAQIAATKVGMDKYFGSREAWQKPPSE
jgi:hypothetical protein